MERVVYPPLSFDELRSGLLPILEAELRAHRSLPGTEQLRALGHRRLAAALRRYGVYRFYGAIRPDVLAVAHGLLQPLIVDGRFPTRDAVLASGWVALTTALRRVGYRRWRDVAEACGYPTTLAVTRSRYDRRRRAAQRLIWSIVKRERRLPGTSRFARRVSYHIQHHGGVRALMKDFLQTGCPAADRPFLAALVAVKRRRKPWRWWQDETRLKRALDPYIELYVASGGHLNVVAKMQADGRNDLVNATKSYGRKGVYALFRSWGVMERLEPQRLRRIQRVLAVAYPSNVQRRILPSSKRIQPECPRLHTRIMECGGYAAVARALDLQTSHQARYADSRRRKLQIIGGLLLDHRGWPPESALHTRRLQTVKKLHGGVVGFFRLAAADPDLEDDVRTVIDRLHRLSRNGVSPHERRRLRRVANQLCLMLPTPRVE